LSFHPDNRRLAVGRGNGSLEIWDVERGEKLLERPAPSPPDFRLCTFSPDGTRLAVQLGSGVLQILQADDAAVLCEREVCTADAVRRWPVFSPDGSLLVSSNDGNHITLWRSQDLALVHTLTGHGDSVNGVDFSPDGTRLVSAGNDSKLKLWDVATGRELATLHGHESNVISVLFLDDDTIVSGGWDGIRFWDAAPLSTSAWGDED
jgi:WD40 repeat protein